MRIVAANQEPTLLSGYGRVYWNARHRLPGSRNGSGSVGRLLACKAQMIGDMIEGCGIRSILDLGCGDGTMAGALDVERYTGVDVSPAAIQKARASREWPSGYRFEAGVVPGEHWDACISMDVAYHLTHDRDYLTHLGLLFGRARRAVGIYTPNPRTAWRRWRYLGSHIRLRNVRKDVALRFPGWVLATEVPPPHPRLSECEWLVWRPL